MLVHNQRYEAGEVTWWKKVTKHYDLTLEEIEKDLGIGNKSYALEFLSHVILKIISK